MERNDHGFLDLEHADDPEREVAHEHERDEGSTRLPLHLGVVLCAPTQPVENEYRLHRGLHQRHADDDQREDAGQAETGNGRRGRDEHEGQVAVGPSEGDDQQDRVEGQEEVLLEPELGQTDVAVDDAAARDEQQRDLHDEEHLDGRHGVLETALEHEEGCYGDEGDDGDEQPREQPLVGLLAVHGRGPVGHGRGQGRVAGPALGDLHPHVRVHAVDDARRDDAVDDGTREQVRRGRAGQGLLLVTALFDRHWKKYINSDLQVIYIK